MAGMHGGAALLADIAGDAKALTRKVDRLSNVWLAAHSKYNGPDGAEDDADAERIAFANLTEFLDSHGLKGSAHDPRVQSTFAAR